MKKTFLIISTVFLFVFATQSLAITQISGELQVTHDEPLFPDSQVWYPGLTKHNTIEVKNTAGSVRGLGVNSTNTLQTGGLADVLIFKIDDGGHFVYGGNDDKTLSDFWNSGGFEIANMGGFETKTIGFTVYMPGTLGNEYQGKEARFDLMIGFLNSSSVIFTASGGSGSGGGAAATSTTATTGTVLAATSKTSNPFSTPELTPILSPTPTSIGQVKGVMTKNFSKYIFPIILLILLIPLILYFYKKKKNSSS